MEATRTHGLQASLKFKFVDITAKVKFKMARYVHKKDENKKITAIVLGVLGGLATAAGISMIIGGSVATVSFPPFTLPLMGVPIAGGGLLILGVAGLAAAFTVWPRVRDKEAFASKLHDQIKKCESFEAFEKLIYRKGLKIDDLDKIINIDKEQVETLKYLKKISEEIKSIEANGADEDFEIFGKLKHTLEQRWKDFTQNMPLLTSTEDLVEEIIENVKNK